MRRRFATLPSDVLVTGAAGILGDALLASGLLGDAIGTVHLKPSRHPSITLDLRNVQATRALMEELRPRVVVHTVALTDVDRCEKAPEEAYALAEGTTRALVAALPADALFVYVSTDQVYGGDGPHREDSAQPVNVYGESKLAGERAALEAARPLVLRTNFFGHSEARPSYTDWIAGTVRRGEPVRVDPRQQFSALHLADLVAIVADAAGRGLIGTFNAASHDSMHKLEFARAVAAASGDADLVVPLEETEGRVPRTLDLRMDASRLEQALGRTLPTMARGLERVLAERVAV